MAASSKTGKGGGARKIGQNKRKPSHAGQTFRTAANKARKEKTLVNRLNRAEDRRAKKSYTDPLTGKTSHIGKKWSRARDGREIQTFRVAKKRRQRAAFQMLSPKQKQAHREAGARSRGA